MTWVTKVFKYQEWSYNTYINDTIFFSMFIYAAVYDCEQVLRCTVCKISLLKYALEYYLIL